MKNVNFVHIFFLSYFLSFFLFFLQRNFSPFKQFPFLLLSSLPILNNFLHPSPYAHYLEVLWPLNKRGWRKLYNPITVTTEPMKKKISFLIPCKCFFHKDENLQHISDILQVAPAIYEGIFFYLENILWEYYCLQYCETKKCFSYNCSHLQFS